VAAPWAPTSPLPWPAPAILPTWSRPSTPSAKAFPHALPRASPPRLARDCLDPHRDPRQPGRRRLGPAIDLAIEAVPEKLDLKRTLFADLARRARPDAWLASKTARAFPSAPSPRGCPHPAASSACTTSPGPPSCRSWRWVLGAASDPAIARELAGFMRSTGKGAGRREEGPAGLPRQPPAARASPARPTRSSTRGWQRPRMSTRAVRFGFGFRYLCRRAAPAEGPCGHRTVPPAAAATSYPDPPRNKVPARCLAEKVTTRSLGMKAGAGFYRLGRRGRSRRKETLRGDSARRLALSSRSCRRSGAEPHWAAAGKRCGIVRRFLHAPASRQIMKRLALLRPPFLATSNLRRRPGARRATSRRSRQQDDRDRLPLRRHAVLIPRPATSSPRLHHRPVQAAWRPSIESQVGA